MFRDCLITNDLAIVFTVQRLNAIRTDGYEMQQSLSVVLQTMDSMTHGQ